MQRKLIDEGFRVRELISEVGRVISFQATITGRNRYAVFIRIFQEKIKQFLSTTSL
jgi:hypothetical protein